LIINPDYLITDMGENKKKLKTYVIFVLASLFKLVFQAQMLDITLFPPFTLLHSSNTKIYKTLFASHIHCCDNRLMRRLSICYDNKR